MMKVVMMPMAEMKICDLEGNGNFGPIIDHRGFFLLSTPPAYLLDNIFVLNSFHKMYPLCIIFNDNLSLKFAEAIWESDIIETQNGRRIPLKRFNRIYPSYEGGTKIPDLL